MSGFVRSLALALLFLASPALAQVVAPTTYNPEIEILQQGAAFTAFVEPGAPTIDLLLVNLGRGGRSSLFRVGEDVTLTQVLALSGAVEGTEESERFIIRSTINVLRDDGNGRRAVIYTAAPEDIFREPGQHPRLQSGDVIEIDNTYERIPQKLTFREGLQIGVSVLSLVSTIILLAVRL